MNEKTFLNDMEELFECDPGSLSLDLNLADTGKWDSLAFVSFMAMSHSQYGIKVAPASLRSCKTVGDLLKLVSTP